MTKLNGLLDSNQAEELKRLFGIEDQSSEDEDVVVQEEYPETDTEDEITDIEDEVYEEPYQEFRNSHVVDRLYRLNSDIEEV